MRLLVHNFRVVFVLPIRSVRLNPFCPTRCTPIPMHPPHLPTDDRTIAFIIHVHPSNAPACASALQRDPLHIFLTHERLDGVLCHWLLRSHCFRSSDAGGRVVDYLIGKGVIAGRRRGRVGGVVGRGQHGERVGWWGSRVEHVGSKWAEQCPAPIRMSHCCMHLVSCLSQCLVVRRNSCMFGGWRSGGGVAPLLPCSSWCL